MNKEKLIQLRKRVNRLFFEDHLSKSEIARRERVTRNFVIEWTKTPDQDFKEDHRGWQKGKRRKWDKLTEKKDQVYSSIFKR